MAFYMYEMMLDEIKQIRDDETKQQEEQEKEYSDKFKSPSSMMSDAQKTFKQGTSNFGNLGSNMNLGSLGSSMPKISIPKI